MKIRPANKDKPKVCRTIADTRSAPANSLRDLHQHSGGAAKRCLISLQEEATNGVFRLLPNTTCPDSARHALEARCFLIPMGCSAQVVAAICSP